MSNVTVVQPLNTTPAQAWSLIGDPATLASWHPAVADSRVEGDTRTLTLGDGALCTERIVSHDDRTMRYRYTIVDAPLPLKDYTATVEVVATENGAEARWSADFEPLGPVDEVEALVRGLYASGLEAARARLEA